MEPFSQLAMFGVGLGLEAYGMFKSQGGYKQMNEGAVANNAAQVSMIGHEKEIEGQRRQAMELQASRSKIQVLREAQIAHSTGLTNAVGQGAQFGSGYAGGQGQISSAAGYNQMTINQDLMLGRNVFDLNALVSNDRIASANASLTMQQGQNTVAEGQGWQNLGSSLVSGSGAFGRLASGGMGRKGA